MAAAVTSIVLPAGKSRHRAVIFATVSLALLMSSLDQTIIATALPSIQRNLHAPISWASWAITVYALGRVIVFPIAGRLSDQFGRRTIFLTSIAVFTLGSLACGFAPDIYALVALRAVQAVGGAAFMPSAAGAVSDAYGENRDRAIGLFTSINPIGAMLGPLAGGVMVEYWQWRGVFLVNVPVGVLLFALGLRFLPAGGTAGKAGRLDLYGMALLAGSVLCAMTGAAYFGSRSSHVLSAGVLIPEVLAAAGIVLFVQRERRASSPFIPVRLMTARGFAAMNTINFLYGSAALGFGALVPLYAIQRYGIGQLASGTLLTARAIGIVSVAALAALLLRRTGYRVPMATGFALTALGLVGLAIPPWQLTTYAWLAAAAALTGIGMGMATPSSNNASIELAPDQVAALTGLRGMFRQGGSIVAVSIVSALIGRSRSAGLTQAYAFIGLAGLLLFAIPLIALVNEHRGSW